jgi:Flp pilus assembly protein TadG
MISTPSVKRRRGASLVEFAFVAPILFVMVLAMIELGRACMVKELLTEAARQACRQSVLEGTSASTVQDTATTYLTNVGINGETAAVMVNDQPIGSTNLATVPAYTEITVVVSVPASSVTWAPSLFVGGTISGQYTMRRE